MSTSASNKKLEKVMLENLRLRMALTDLTKAYVKVIDLFISSSMEHLGLKPKKK